MAGETKILLRDDERIRTTCDFQDPSGKVRIVKCDKIGGRRRSFLLSKNGLDSLTRHIRDVDEHVSRLIRSNEVGGVYADLIDSSCLGDQTRLVLSVNGDRIFLHTETYSYEQTMNGLRTYRTLPLGITLTSGEWSAFKRHLLDLSEEPSVEDPKEHPDATRNSETTTTSIETVVCNPCGKTFDGKAPTEIRSQTNHSHRHTSVHREDGERRVPFPFHNKETPALISTANDEDTSAFLYDDNKGKTSSPLAAEMSAASPVTKRRKNSSPYPRITAPVWNENDFVNIRISTGTFHQRP